MNPSESWKGWLVGVPLGVLQVSQPRQSDNLWPYDLQIWQDTHKKRNKYLAVHPCIFEFLGVISALNLLFQSVLIQLFPARLHQVVILCTWPRPASIFPHYSLFASWKAFFEIQVSFPTATIINDIFNEFFPHEWKRDVVLYSSLSVNPCVWWVFVVQTKTWEAACIRNTGFLLASQLLLRHRAFDPWTADRL